MPGGAIPIHERHYASSTDTPAQYWVIPACNVNVTCISLEVGNHFTPAKSELEEA